MEAVAEEAMSENEEAAMAAVAEEAEAVTEEDAVAEPEATPATNVEKAAAPAVEVMDATKEDEGLDMESAEALMARVRQRRAETTNTDQTYSTYQRQFVELMSNHGLSQAVTGKKLARYMRWQTERVAHVQQRVPGSRRGRKGATQQPVEPPKHLHPATIHVSACAVIDMWVSQENKVIEFRGKLWHRSKEHPRTAEVQNIIHEYEERWGQLRVEERHDPTKGTVAENGGTTSLDIGGISQRLFNKNSHVADRTRLDAVFGAVCIGRADEKRNLNLSGCVLVDLDIGPSRCGAFLGLMNRRKTSKGKVTRSYLSALRHCAVWCCPINALAVYLHRRFEHEGEKFPAFEEGRGWYDVKLLVSSFSTASKTQPIAASTEAQQIADVLQEASITASKTAHIFRAVGTHDMELNADGFLQEGQVERLGGWNQNVMRRIYSKHVPFQAALVMAGYSSTNFKDKYLVERAPDKTTLPPEEFTNCIGIYRTCKEWIENAAAHPDRKLRDGHTICGASLGFARLVVFAMVTLVEDAPFMMVDAPSHMLWRHEPFNTPAFLAWAEARRGSVKATASSVVNASKVQSTPIKEALVKVSEQVAALQACVQAKNDAERLAPRQLGSAQHLHPVNSSVQFEMVFQPQPGQATVAGRSGHDRVPAGPPGAVQTAAPASSTAAPWTVVPRPGLQAATPASALSNAAQTAAPPQGAAVQVFEDGSGAAPLAAPPSQPTVPVARAVLRPIANSRGAIVHELHRQGVKTVLDVWNELVHGLNGTASVRSILIAHGCHWASKGRTKEEAHKEQALQSKRKSKRKTVWDEVLRLAAEGRADADQFQLTSTPDDALCDTKAKELQTRYDDDGWFTGTGKKTLDKFIKVLESERKARKGAEKKRKAAQAVADGGET